MSSVRMCDGCGLIFSEKDPNWANATVNRRRFNPRTERMETIEEEEDRCGSCATGQTVKTPQIAIEGLPNVQQ